MDMRKEKSERDFRECEKILLGCNRERDEEVL